MYGLAVVTFIGVILVVNPAFILRHFGVDYSDQVAENASKDVLYYAGVAIGCFGAFSVVANNFLIAGMAAHIHPIQNSFYALLGFMTASGIFMLFEEKDGPWLFVDYIYLASYYVFLSGNQITVFLMAKYEKRQTILSIILNFQVLWNFI